MCTTHEQHCKFNTKKFVRKLQLMDVQDKLDLNDGVIYGFNFNIILVTSDVANCTKNLHIFTPFP